MSLISRFRSWRNKRQIHAVASITRNEPALPRFAPPKRKGLTSAILQELAALLRIPTKQDRAFGRTLKMVKPFPGVVPPGAPAMALDSQITGALTFARGQGFGEDFGFLGYALLSELMQVPEYRRPSEILAGEMTRKWIKVISVGKKDQTEKIKVIEDELKRLGAQEAFRRAFEHDNGFGIGHIFLDLGVDADLEKPLALGANVEKDSLKALRIIEPIWTYPNDYNCTDPTAPDFYRPQTWWVLSKKIHASRMLNFVSRPVPDLLKPAYLFGGVSLTQLLQPYVQNWLRTRQSVSNITHNFSTPVFKTDLGQLTEPGGAQLLYNRINVFNTARDNQGAMVVDHDREDFVNVSAPLSGLDKLQAQAQEQQASIAGIPLVKYFGITPSGLNASSDGEIRAFYDTIESTQKRVGTPQLRRLIDLIQMSKFGKVDPDIGFVWMPLWSLDEKGLAEVRKINAETDCAYADHQVLDLLEIRKTIAAEEGSRYASIDVEELPEPVEEQEDGDDDGDRDGDAPDAHLREGGGEDAQLPFASDATFNEADHPRAENGEFGSGSGSSKPRASKPKLTSTEKAYLDSYSGDDFLKLNAKLRAGEWGGPAVEKIDSAISKSTVPAGSKLYRGISKDALRALIGGNQINAGQVLSDPGFLSTSTSRTIAGLNAIGGVVMEIEVGHGQNGIDMSGITRNKHEKEVILPRDTKMKVLGLRAPKAPGDPIIVRVSAGGENRQDT